MPGIRPSGKSMPLIVVGLKSGGVHGPTRISNVSVGLGAPAIEGLLGKTIGITRLRGNWQSYRGIPLMPTYHPAYLLRNLPDKAKAWEDLLLARSTVASSPRGGDLASQPVA